MSLPCTLVSQESPGGHHHRRHHRDCRRSAEPRGLWETPSPGGAQHEVQLGGGDAGEAASPPHQGPFRQRTPAESLGPLRVTAQGCSRSEAGEHRRSGERRRQTLELLPAVLSAQGSRAHVEANEAEGAVEHRPARWTLGLGTGDEVEVTGARGVPAAQGGPPPRLYRTCSLPRARRPPPAGHVPRSGVAYTFQAGLLGSPDSAHPRVPTAASAKRDEVRAGPERRISRSRSARTLPPRGSQARPVLGTRANPTSCRLSFLLRDTHCGCAGHVPLGLLTPNPRSHTSHGALWAGRQLG